jgi:hypothetical protein
MADERTGVARDPGIVVPKEGLAGSCMPYPRLPVWLQQSCPILFRDSEQKLDEQLEMAIQLSTWFNETIVWAGSTEIDIEQLRQKLQSEVARKTAIWVSLASTR